MERLTERGSEGVVALTCREGCLGGPACLECEQRAVDRLAAYEDTGLEPFEVEQIKLLIMGAAVAELKEFDGIPIQRLQELIKAEKDRRLVVLDEPTALAMAAGARAIENNKRLEGASYVYDFLGVKGGPKEITYYRAAKLLRALVGPILKGRPRGEEADDD